MLLKSVVEQCNSLEVSTTLEHLLRSASAFRASMSRAQVAALEAALEATPVVAADSADLAADALRNEGAAESSTETKNRVKSQFYFFIMVSKCC